MIAKALLNTIYQISTILQLKEIPFMFMGGLAISIWGEPRATYDIDGVIKVNKNQLEELLNEFSQKGFRYDTNAPIKIIQSMPFITLIYQFKKRKIYIDLFLAKSEYEKQALSRRQQINLKDINITLITPEDLILYKLLAGRTRDIDDIREILVMQKETLDMKYLKKWAKKLGVITYLEDELSSLGIYY